MKRFLCLTAMTIAMLSMTACGEDKNDNNGNDNSATSSTLEIDAQYTDLGGLETMTNESGETVIVTTETTTVEATEEATEAVPDDNGSSGGGISYESDYKAVDEVKKDENKDIIYDNLRLVPVPDAEPTHPDINFGLVKHDEVEFDVFDIDVETFEGYVERASCTSALKHNTDDFYFYGVPFTTGECYLELITPQDTITRCNTTSKDVLYPCDIKGMAVEDSIAFTFYGDITIGTPETKVEEVLGKGIIGCTYVDTNDYDREKRTVIYKSETTTMVIIYLDSENIAGESVGAVDKIFVLQND